MGESCISVNVIPMEEVDTRLIEYLAQQLELHFDSCIIGDRIDMPEGAYNGLRVQYMASLVVQALLEAYPATQAKLLGVTDADLYAQGLECVVGQAQAEGAVLSVRRLGAGEALCSRVVKEAIHELGHTLGLRHCLDSRCVMRYSRYVNEIDEKSDSFCASCKARLCHVGAG